MDQSQVARANMLSQPRTINGKKVILVFTGREAVRTIMKEFCTNVSFTLRKIRKIKANKKK
jgi:hypothetical protein